MKPIQPRKFSYNRKEKVTVSIRLPEDLKEKLEQIAEKNGLRFSEFVQIGLDQWAALHFDKER